MTIKEQVNDKEAICILIIFTLGSTILTGIAGEAENDKWFAGVIGLLIAMPMILIYARILHIFRGRDIFDILVLLFGQIGGRVIALFFFWYCFHLGALVTRNFGEFINVVALPETPMMVPMLAVGLLAVYAVVKGIEVIGRTSAYILPITLAILIMVQLLAIPEMSFSNLKPFLGTDTSTLLKSSFSSFSFPFAESVLFLGVFFTLKTKKSPYKVYFTGLSIAGALIIVITARNTLILGDVGNSFFFPSYVAVSGISIGEFIQRIEVSVAFVLAVGSFIKISICLYVAVNILAKVFKLRDYRTIVLQTGLIMVFMGHILYKSTMDMQDWAIKIYPFYAFPFQVILPIVVWILSEVKKKKFSSQKDTQNMLE